MNRPGVFTRIVDGVAHTFPDRKIEWIMAGWALAWGGRWIVDPADNLKTASGAWDAIRLVFHADWVFAAMMVTVGIGRLLALTINGTFKDTVYAQYSPVVRAITGVMCGLLWLFLWVSAMGANSQGIVTYLFPALIEFVGAVFVVDESADVLREWRNGRRAHGR